MQAHRQWMSRAPDERLTSLLEMQAFKRRVRDNSRSQVISSRGLTVRPVEDDARALQIMGRRQRPSSGGADALVVRAAVFARQPRKFAGKGQAIPAIGGAEGLRRVPTAMPCTKAVTSEPQSRPGEFAPDSPLEGTGFELPVRGRGQPGFVALYAVCCLGRRPPDRRQGFAPD